MLTLSSVQKANRERSFQDDTIEVTTTKPSSKKKDSIISETESLGATTSVRASSIRFKEPDENFDEVFVHKEPLPPHLVFKPTPSLKNSGSESKRKLLKSGKVSTSVTSSSDTDHYRSPLSPPFGSVERPTRRWGTQFSTSFSLENVSYGAPLDTTNKYYDRKKVLHKRKTWSYDDLATIKKELNEPMSPSDRDHSSLMLFEFIPKKSSVIIPSPRHKNLIENLRLSSMSKDDILAMWRSSERELLNQLQDALQQKRALEEKVALLQRMLMKPP